MLLVLDYRRNSFGLTFSFSGNVLSKMQAIVMYDIAHPMDSNRKRLHPHIILTPQGISNVIKKPSI
jgi:hypothetical protein